MPIEPVKIPQNVYVEDRIIGPLTLKQTLVMAVGGGFSYALYATLSKAYGHLSILVTIIVWLPALIAAIFALVKINDLSLMRICFLLLERMNKAPIRTWTLRRGISINIRTSALASDEKAKAPVQSQTDEQAMNRIRELSAVVDKPAINAPAAEETAVVPIKTPPATPSSAKENEEVVMPEKPATSPVDPSRISVDGKSAPNLKDDPPLSNDLRVFRDIFPSA